MSSQNIDQLSTTDLKNKVLSSISRSYTFNRVRHSKKLITRKLDLTDFRWPLAV